MKRFERKAQSQRKHGPLSNSGASKAPVAPPTHRPGWKGPGYIKKVARKPTPSLGQENAPIVKEQIISEDIQQLILDVFRGTLPESNDFDAIKPALREIKDAIAERDFKRAFETEQCLERYTLRWSPSTALACSNILAWVCSEWEDNEWVKRFNDDTAQSPANVTSFGRGAAGYMTLVAALRHLHSSAAGQSLPNEAGDITETLDSLAISELQSTAENSLLNISIVDATNWSSVVSKLHHYLTTPPPLSQYATAKARASNPSALSPQALNWKFTQVDILEYEVEDLRSMIGPDATLLTLFFTLSDLYLTSISKTSAFLRKLTAAAPTGSLLLVVDSPDVSIGSGVRSNPEEEEKRYPMHWLMYQALLPRQVPKAETKKEEREMPWKKLAEENNSIYKLAKGLRFPVSLENTRFQMHLLERL